MYPKNNNNSNNSNNNSNRYPVSSPLATAAAAEQYPPYSPYSPHRPLPAEPRQAPTTSSSFSYFEVVLKPIPPYISASELTHCLPPCGLLKVTVWKNNTATALYDTEETADFAARYFRLNHDLYNSSRQLLALNTSHGVNRHDDPTVGLHENCSIDFPNRVEYTPPSHLLYYSKMLRLCDQLTYSPPLWATRVAQEDEDGNACPPPHPAHESIKTTVDISHIGASSNTNTFSIAPSSFTNNPGGYQNLPSSNHHHHHHHHMDTEGVAPTHQQPTYQSHSPNEISGVGGFIQTRTVYVSPKAGAGGAKNILNTDFFTGLAGYEYHRQFHSAFFVRFKDREYAEKFILNLPHSEAGKQLNAEFANKDSR